MSDTGNFVVVVILLFFLSLYLRSSFVDFSNHPTSELSANDVIDGYIVIAIVDDFHVFAEKPNDDTCYLLTISENFSELSFLNS